LGRIIAEWVSVKRITKSPRCLVPGDLHPKHVKHLIFDLTSKARGRGIEDVGGRGACARLLPLAVAQTDVVVSVEPRPG
jgi:hypothetical protein